MHISDDPVAIIRILETTVPTAAELVLAAECIRRLVRANNEKAAAMERLADQLISANL